MLYLDNGMRGFSNMDEIDRFMQSVDKTDNCWNWTRGKTGNQQRYGACYLHHKKERAHRVAWELFNGEIPDGMCVCHTCDNPLCCNPNHLFLGTHADNMQDKSHKGRTNPVRGDRASWKKLCSSDVLKIREVYSTGNYTQRELAKLYRVSQSTILFILQRRNWASIQ